MARSTTGQAHRAHLRRLWRGTAPGTAPTLPSWFRRPLIVRAVRSVGTGARLCGLSMYAPHWARAGRCGPTQPPLRSCTNLTSSLSGLQDRTIHRTGAPQPLGGGGAAGAADRSADSQGWGNARSHHQLHTETAQLTQPSGRNSGPERQPRAAGGTAAFAACASALLQLRGSSGSSDHRQHCRCWNSASCHVRAWVALMVWCIILMVDLANLASNLG